jgi:hypothetical protein
MNGALRPKSILPKRGEKNDGMGRKDGATATSSSWAGGRDDVFVTRDVKSADLRPPKKWLSQVKCLAFLRNSSVSYTFEQHI